MRLEKVVKDAASFPRVLLLAVFSLSSARCGLVSPSDTPQTHVYSGVTGVPDEGVFSLDFEANFRSDGTLRADFNWTVVAPGVGRFATQPPELQLDLAHGCGSFGCSIDAVAGPATEGPLTVTARVHTVTGYLLSVGNRRLCGGCQIQYRLEVTHPPGSVRFRAR